MIEKLNYFYEKAFGDAITMAIIKFFQEEVARFVIIFIHIYLFLQSFIEKYNVYSICELGCGSCKTLENIYDIFLLLFLSYYVFYIINYLLILYSFYNITNFLQYLLHFFVFSSLDLFYCETTKVAKQVVEYLICLIKKKTQF